MQFTADLTEVNLRVSTLADCSPLGAALAGLLGMGLIRSLDEIAAMEIGELIYRPTSDATHIQSLYAGWQRAVRQVLPNG